MHFWRRGGGLTTDEYTKAIGFTHLSKLIGFLEGFERVTILLGGRQVGKVGGGRGRMKFRIVRVFMSGETDV